MLFTSSMLFLFLLSIKNSRKTFPWIAALLTPSPRHERDLSPTVMALIVLNATMCVQDQVPLFWTWNALTR